MTQLDRVVKVLMDRGWVYRTDFRAPDVIDQGDPILNLGERIRDLRSDGWQIKTVRMPNGTAKYELEAMPATAVDEGSDEPSTLFGGNVGIAPPRSHYEEAA